MQEFPVVWSAAGAASEINQGDPAACVIFAAQCCKAALSWRSSLQQLTCLLYAAVPALCMCRCLLLSCTCACSNQGVLWAAGCRQQAGAGRHPLGKEKWREVGLPCLKPINACPLRVSPVGALRLSRFEGVSLAICLEEGCAVLDCVCCRQLSCRGVG